MSISPNLRKKLAAIPLEARVAGHIGASGFRGPKGYRDEIAPHQPVSRAPAAPEAEDMYRPIDGYAWGIS